MRVGLVSDIHCNLNGLDDALALMGSVDEVWCAGDAFNQYRFSNEVVARIQEIGARYILGNHEDMLLAPSGERAQNNPNVDQRLLAWVRDRPHFVEAALGGREVLMFHSTPWEPYEEYIYPHSRDLLRLGELNFDIAIYGHTHMQLAREVNGTLIVNPGSAGLGQDPSNGKKLSCAVLETDDRTVAFYNYDMRR